jgi:hypothetical protein
VANWKGIPLFVRGNTARDDEANLSSGPFGIERCHTFKSVFYLFEHGMHRAHQHPIFKRGKS